MQNALPEMIEEIAEGRRITRLSRQVHAFHELLGQAELSSPGIPPDDQVRLRVVLVLEEAFEFALACCPSIVFCELRDQAAREAKVACVNVDLVEVADAMADVDYVVEGSRLVFGINGLPVADEVHRTNMLKMGGEKSPEGKFLKPKGWHPPDIFGVLREQGYGK